MLLPPPPAEESAAKSADLEALQQALQASPERLALAAADTVLEWGQIIRSFEAILGTSLSGPTQAGKERDR